MNRRLRIPPVLFFIAFLAVLCALIIPVGFSTTRYVDYATARQQTVRKAFFVVTDSSVQDTPLTEYLSTAYRKSANPDWFKFSHKDKSVVDVRVNYEAAHVVHFYNEVAAVLATSMASDEAKRHAATAAITYVRQNAVRGKGVAFLGGRMKSNGSELTLEDRQGQVIWHSVSP